MRPEPTEVVVHDLVSVMKCAETRRSLPVALGVSCTEEPHAAQHNANREMVNLMDWHYCSSPKAGDWSGSGNERPAFRQ